MWWWVLVAFVAVVVVGLFRRRRCVFCAIVAKEVPATIVHEVHHPPLLHLLDLRPM